MAKSPSLNWSVQLAAVPLIRPLSGDKVLLPPSALEQLLAAAPASSAPDEVESSAPLTSTFDPFNPYSYAAERSVRSRLQARQHERQPLPHPLTFRLVNPATGRAVYAGIREFSAEEGCVGLSPFLRQALGLVDVDVDVDGDGDAPRAGIDQEESRAAATTTTTPTPTPPQITIHARQLPKGTYVRLRPLEAGYEADDWKSLLEQHLRTNFTTLTKHEVLAVPGLGRSQGNDFRFLVDQIRPDGAEGAICIVDTDLEVDMEPLDEEQARETMQQRLAAAAATETNGVPGSAASSGQGGRLAMGQRREGVVPAGGVVDYQIARWDGTKDVVIEVGPGSGMAHDADADAELDLFVSPLSARQRARPRPDEHVWGDFTSRYPKRIRIRARDDGLQGAEAIYVAVHAYAASDDGGRTTVGTAPRTFYLQASAASSTTDEDPTGGEGTTAPPHTDDERQCGHCLQWVPARTMLLHSNFCERNNVRCADCQAIFLKTSPEWAQHWHCAAHAACGSGDSRASQRKHDAIHHPPRALRCPSCPDHAATLPALARHRTTTCAAKPIVCAFCHLQVPQEAAPSTATRDLTGHEYADGARTADCPLCAKPVRLRDLPTHHQHHDHARRHRPRPAALCRNVNCGRLLPLPGPSSPGPPPPLGLCSFCFGPLYVPFSFSSSAAAASSQAKEDEALRRRLERRYVTQLVRGCAKAWCANELCKDGRVKANAGGGVGPLPLAPSAAVAAHTAAAAASSNRRVYLCVDEASQLRRSRARQLVMEMAATTTTTTTTKTEGGEGGEGGEAGDGAEGGDGAEKDGDAASYALEWALVALDLQPAAAAAALDFEAARAWLRECAPTVAEERARGVGVGVVAGGRG
ncbi:MAG: hypothetical protein M1826_001834 [Phylliscum demangeonii]|nr:MAG: hypothetical protein M1826_001834 [Phylliscum demangeonii]